MIGIAFTGVAGIIAALSTFNANRSKRIELEHRYLKGRVITLEQQVLDLSEYSFTLRTVIVGMGGKAPPLPSSLNKPISDEVLNNE